MGGIHVAAHLVGGGPEGGIKAESRAAAIVGLTLSRRSLSHLVLLLAAEWRVHQTDDRILVNVA